MALWDEVKKNLVDLYSTTSEKTTEIARITSRKYDKFGISRDIERQFSELGNVVYTGIKEERADILEDPAIATLVSRIEGLEQELNLKEEEIDAIRTESQNKRSAAAAGGATVSDVIIKDPALEPGNEDSAILVEPIQDEAATVDVSQEKQDISRTPGQKDNEIGD